MDNVTVRRTQIDQLIINSPYEEPANHWRYARQSRSFELAPGRRAAGYLVASEDSKQFDDPGEFVEIPLVNQIRRRVQQWRRGGYAGVTGTTKRLLAHWTNLEEFDRRRFFFCQLEAVETLIWLAEAPDHEKVGIDIPSDGGLFKRLCSKMATGSGKTVVMAMVIAWHVLNKTARQNDSRFSRNVLIIAPGLTVRNRLAVLKPTHPDNYYQAFHVVPTALLDKLHRAQVVIRNWHALVWENAEKIARKRGVDKRGAKSDQAYVREVLGDMAQARNMLVINDEAHHAWRVPAGSKIKGVAKQVKEATKWVGGLDRIHKTRGILKCYDFTATPFAPSGNRRRPESLFGWIVSDFGLNDAIESGLVKTPRVVVRDDAVPDAKSYKSRLYHIYNDPEVKPDLNRRAQSHEPLPDLILNAYHLLGHDWRVTAENWLKHPTATPPVMITVANRTETAARVKHAFDHRKIPIEELCDRERTLHIDSKVLSDAESTEEPIAEIGEASEGIYARKLNRKQRAELLRQQVDTVGRPGKPGENIQNVISVGMLSEGWDAKTVTHIMGLRAFSSQLLCEQVVGRGLRRTSYDINPQTSRFEPEYVNVFGIPFTFLPHEQADTIQPPPKPKTAIQPLKERISREITWPNVIRINHNYSPRLTLDDQALDVLEIDAAKTAKSAELAETVGGKPDMSRIKTIDLIQLAERYRMQRIIFETVRDVYDQMQHTWSGGKTILLAQLVRVVNQFINSDRIRIVPPPTANEDLLRRLILALNMSSVVQHVHSAIRFQNTKHMELVFDQDRPISSTQDMETWYTSRPCEHTKRSHINFCVYDSTWEAADAYVLDNNPHVASWVKNDHLGYEILYVYRGRVRKYRPDFLIRLRTGTMLVLETKGQDNEHHRTKRKYLNEWVQAVNADGGFGRWSCDVVFGPGEIEMVLNRHASAD